jgi:hypothetical protein
VQGLRSHLVAMSMLVVACQVALASIPLAAVIRTAVLDVPIKAECRCDVPGHEHASCAMHHSRNALKQTSADAARCRLSQAASIHLDFLTASGSLPEPALHLTVPVVSAIVTVPRTFRLESRSPVLDPPPPRF